MNLQPIPAEPPLTGPLWSVVLPIVVFAGSLAATYLLYRHFARAGAAGRDSEPRPD